MFKSAARGFFALPLTTQRISAGNTVMNMRRDCFHGFFSAMVVDVVEGLTDFFLNNVTV